MTFSADRYIRTGATGRTMGTIDECLHISPEHSHKGEPNYYIASGRTTELVDQLPESGSTWTYIRKATVAGHGTGEGWNDPTQPDKRSSMVPSRLNNSYIRPMVYRFGNSGHGIR